MAISDADLWHQVHAQREDGVPAMFLVRDVEPRVDQPQIFVVQMPYSTTDLSRLPDAAGYRRLDAFQEQWIEPACASLGWTFVAWKSEDGSFFLYLYGDGDPNVLLEKLSPFDSALGFFNDRDAEWAEYAALRELVEQAEAAPEDEPDNNGVHIHTADCDHEHNAPGHLNHHDHDHGHRHDAAVRRPRARAETIRETRLNPVEPRSSSVPMPVAEPPDEWEDIPTDELLGTRSRATTKSGKTKAAAPATKPAAPAKKPAARTAAPSKKPAAKATAPAKKPAAPIKKPAAPIKKPAAPIKKPAAPVKKPAAPIKKVAAPIKKAVASIKKAVASIKKAATPAKKSAAKPRR